MTIKTFINRYISRTAIVVLGLAAALALPVSALAQDDAALQAKIQKSLSNSRFKDVQVAVAGNVVTLTGTVKLFADKEDADNKAHHANKAAAIRNQIQVGGPTVADAVLYKKLSEKIAWDRLGYGTTPFNAIDIRVQNGTVYMSGHAYGPTDKDSAVDLVKYYPGVKDVVDDVQVDPVSGFDDQSRQAEYRAIYGFGALSKYGSDPAKPIRITVINGTVILSGVVDNKTDKDMAYLRASSVPGVFKVINNLQVAGQPPTEAATTTNTVTK